MDITPDHAGQEPIAVSTDRTPVWKATAERIEFPRLERDIEVDVAIIGGGITGITTAYCLSKEGKKVVVLEALKIGEGTTGYSTGNLYAVVDERLYQVRKHFDEDTMRKVVASRNAGIDFIENRVKEFNIDCDFGRQPWYLFTESEEFSSSIEKEFNAAKDSYLPVSEEKSLSIPFRISKAIRIDNQAQFNPMQYVKAFADNIAGNNCMIFEHSKVEQIDEGEKIVLHCGKGKVTARSLVMATHTPKGIMDIQTLLAPYREYGIAFKLKNNNYPPRGIFWKTATGHHHSFRSYEHRDEKYLVVVGAPHKVGHEPKENGGFKELEEFARKRFDVERIAYQWSAQHYHASDGLPYIGKHDKNIYIATGFATDGLVYGTVSGMLISDLIVGKENEWKNIYDPSRHAPIASAKNTISQNLDVAKQYIKDWPASGDASQFSEVKQGYGMIIEKNGQKLAAYRDEQNVLHVVSAVCTHMKCIVHWNKAEKSWDCPCHGSRFTKDGSVIEGPAIADLPKMKIEPQTKA